MFIVRYFDIHDNSHRKKAMGNVRLFVLGRRVRGRGRGKGRYCSEFREIWFPLEKKAFGAGRGMRELHYLVIRKERVSFCANILRASLMIADM